MSALRSARRAMGLLPDHDLARRILFDANRHTNLFIINYATRRNPHAFVTGMPSIDAYPDDGNDRTVERAADGIVFAEPGTGQQESLIAEPGG